MPKTASPHVVFKAGARFVSPPVAFAGPDDGHWVTIDGEHVLIRGEPRHPGYTGTPEGLIHPGAPKVRYALLDRSAVHERELAEHDRVIREHTREIRAALKDSGQHEPSSPGYARVMKKVQRLEDTQARHIVAKRATRESMDSDLGSVLHSPTPGLIEASVPSGSGEARARRAVSMFNQLVSPSVASGSAEFHEAEERSNYRAAEDRITMNPADSTRVGVHELGHWLERHNPHVSEKARAFLAYRTKGAQPQPLSALTGNPHYGTGEVASADRFAHPYMGKAYFASPVRGTQPGEDRDHQVLHTPTEIMSMGLERLARASDAVAFAKADPEMFDFVVSTARGMGA